MPFVTRAVQQIRDSLTPAQLLAASIQGVVMAGVARLFLLGLGIKPPREWLFIISVFMGAFLLVMVASVFIGRERHPRFSGEFAAITFGEMEACLTPATSTTREKFTFVSPVLDISNIGAPSIAKGYKLTVLFTDGTKKEGEGFNLRSAGVVAFTHSSGAAEIYNEEDLLLRKSLNPIPRGGFVQGRLLFRMPNLSVSDLRTIGNRFRVEFSDLWGQSYAAEFKYTDHSDSMLHYAGMSASQLMMQPELTANEPTATRPSELAPDTGVSTPEQAS